MSHALRLAEKSAAMSPGWFAESPTELFRRQVWVSPFWEDHPVELGRDDRRRPHPVRIGLAAHRGALADPVWYRHELAGLPDDAIDQVMGTNAVELTGPPP